MAVTSLISEERRSILEAVLESVNKRYGSGSLWAIGETEIPRVDVISTNAITLDQALGIGGIPRGRITEIYGPESSGKTTLALHIVANVQRSGGTAAIIDVEHALDFEYAARLGVNIHDLLVSQPDTGEQALDITESLVRGGIDCVVVDSVAMLIPEAELRGEMSDFQVGAQARLMSKALRKLTAPVADSKCALVMINQVREKIGGYGNPITTPGGRALRFAASIRIELAKKETVTVGGENIGILVKAKVVKNKLASPANTAEFNVYFNRGIDRTASLVDAADLAGVITKSGTWYKYDGNSIGQGKERVVEKLNKEPLLAAEIERKLLEAR
jgi:recombination protein RecA